MLKRTHFLFMFYFGGQPDSVMQSDGNSLKIDAFREAKTSELMITS